MKCGKSANLANDVLNLASTIGDLSDNAHIPDVGGNIPKGGKWARRGFWLHGPGEGGDTAIDYGFVCRRRNEKGEFGPGTCGVIEITRSGPGAKGMKPAASVGNLHGLVMQLSRDLSRLYGCEVKATPGFEGVRPRRRRSR